MPDQGKRTGGSQVPVVPGPGACGPGTGPGTGPDDPLGPPRHFERGAAREGQEQDALGLRARQHEMRHPVRERVGFARSGAGNDQQGARSELRGFLLLAVQRSRADSCGTSVTIPRLSPFSSPPSDAPKGLRRTRIRRIFLLSDTTSAVPSAEELRWLNKLVGQNYETPDIRAKVTGRAQIFRRFPGAGHALRPSAVEPVLAREDSQHRHERRAGDAGRESDPAARRRARSEGSGQRHGADAARQSLQRARARDRAALPGRAGARRMRR